MAKRGGTKHLKSLVAPATFNIDRKKMVWVQRQLPGPHNLRNSIPLSLSIKMARFAKTMKEVKKILSSRAVKVDGKIITEPKHPIGLMDVLSIAGKHFRILLNRKNQIFLEETENFNKKVCKIISKKRTKKGKIQFILHDGKTLLDYKGKRGDSVLISLPDYKPIQEITLGVGSKCFVSGGKYIGSYATIKKITEGTAMRKAEVECDINGENHITLKSYIIPIADNSI